MLEVGRHLDKALKNPHRQTWTTNAMPLFHWWIQWWGDTCE